MKLLNSKVKALKNMKYLQLIRYKNLLFIVLIQVLMHQLILIPILQKYGFDTAEFPSLLYLLIISTILIAAGGYVLNDYFDVKIDAINQPEKLIVGKLIPKEKAMQIYQVLTILGLLVGLLLSYLNQSLTLALIYIGVTGLLWFYSASYKRQFLVGNLVVSALAALTVLIVGISGIAQLKQLFSDLIYETPLPFEIYTWMGGFTIFSFLLTWIREIIKDMEDEPGDRELECRSLPIVLGFSKSKILIVALIILTISLLLIANFILIPFEGLLTLKYIVFGITMPFILLIYLLLKARNTTEYHQCSQLTKIIMFVGVLYSFIFYFLMAKSYGLSLFNLFYVK